MTRTAADTTGVTGPSEHAADYKDLRGSDDGASEAATAGASDTDDGNDKRRIMRVGRHMTPIT